MMLMYEDGNPGLMIARETQVTPLSVYAALRAHGVTIRPKGGPRRNTWSLEAVALHRQGFTAAAIGRKIGRTRERVRQVLIAEFGQDYRPNRRLTGHRCTDRCSQVQALQGDTFIAIGQRLGVSWSTVSRIASAHGIRGGQRHRCDDRCTAIRTALEAGKTARAAAVSGFGAAWSKGHVSVFLGNLKSYHPEFPWFDARTKGGPGVPHVCGERCEKVRHGLEAGIPPYRTLRTVCAMASRAAGNYNVRVKHNHPDWPWPARRTAKTVTA